mmetsp:Transcript_13140/g.18823  ORF Transcript_13140/g.18823 Transcript_13140/m.18823 type:complete len:84 (+) Transcript_13140:631-882(+)
MNQTNIFLVSTGFEFGTGYATHMVVAELISMQKLRTRHALCQLNNGLPGIPSIITFDLTKLFRLKQSTFCNLKYLVYCPLSII